MELTKRLWRASVMQLYRNTVNTHKEKSQTANRQRWNSVWVKKTGTLERDHHKHTENENMSFYKKKEIQHFVLQKVWPSALKLKHLTIEKWIKRESILRIQTFSSHRDLFSSFAMATTICLGTLITKSPQWVIIRLGDYPIHTEKSNRLDPITARHTHPCSSTHICKSFVIMMACACVYVCVCV